MKKTAAALTLLSLFVACQQNPTTGEYIPTWLFWVFLGFLLFGVFFGVVANSIRPKKNKTDANGIEITKAEEEIEKYEEALKKKEEIENQDKDK